MKSEVTETGISATGEKFGSDRTDVLFLEYYYRTFVLLCQAFFCIFLKKFIFCLYSVILTVGVDFAEKIVYNNICISL